MTEHSLARGVRRRTDLEHVSGIAGRILEDAGKHAERTYSEHVAAAEEIAAKSYRDEIRAMMRVGTLDPEPGEYEL